MKRIFATILFFVLFASQIHGDILKGGSIGDGYDLASIEVGEHDGYTRVVFGIKYWEGDTENGGKLVDDGGHYIFSMEKNDVILADFSGFRSATTTIPSFEDHPLIKEIILLRGEEYADDSSVYFHIVLHKKGKIEASYLTNPARFVLDIYPK
jgi:hypothetical protein